MLKTHNVMHSASGEVLQAASDKNPRSSSPYGAPLARYSSRVSATKHESEASLRAPSSDDGAPGDVLDTDAPPYTRYHTATGASPPALTTLLLPSILNNMLKYSASLDGMFHALADPTRRAMVERLSRGPATVSELAQPFSVSLPAVVQHLQVLEASGLVRSTKVGRVRTCQLEPQALKQAELWINERRKVWEQRLDRLGEYLDAHPDEPADRSNV